MSKITMPTSNLESTLHADFLVEVTSADKSAQPQTREYDVYLHSKVEAGRASMRAGLGRSNEEVEAEFAARRSKVERCI